jgi:hypothetical protein
MTSWFARFEMRDVFVLPAPFWKPASVYRTTKVEKLL